MERLVHKNLIHINFSTDHRDYEGIRNAVIKIDKIIQFVNEEKRNTEKILNVVSIQNRISNLPFHLVYS